MIYRRLLPSILLVALATALAACSSAAPPRPTASPAPEPIASTAGEALISEDWTVTITGVTFDATDEVAAANEFNPAPEDGQEYALLAATVERAGAPSAALDIDITLFVDGQAATPAAVVAPEPLRILAEFTPGTPVNGQLVFAVPAGTNAADVRVSVGDDRVFQVPVK